MKATKTVIGSLEKCYALGIFHYDGIDHIAVAAEKQNSCYTFDACGKRIDTLWEGPGGVMTLTQVPGKPILLATRKFYSPNDSAEANIVYCRKVDGEWTVETLCRLPFVHRFGILTRGNRHYLIACTLKSAHAFKNDWTCPGRIWAAPLPEDVTEYNESNQLNMKPLVSGLTKNHGFTICREGNDTFAMVASENGVYKVCPPETDDGEWTVEQLLNIPASDILYLDFDGDGERELLVLSPFHGDTLTIHKQINGEMKEVYRHDKAMPFLHAIWGEAIEGRAYAFIGCRQADRDLIALYYDAEKQDYVYDTLDQGAGAANVLYYRAENRHLLFAANRETDEIAMYELNAKA